MRLYGKKFVRKYVDRRVNQRKETSDGILWSVDHVAKVARVRIQGSNEDIVAHYPRNWKAIPYWLKPRNAVRIIWREGNRGYIEISGEGRAIPTPVTGPAFPEITPPGDHWLYGGKLLPTSPESLNLSATAGAYVIDGETYFFNPSLVGGDIIYMDDPPPMYMGENSPFIMGGEGLYSVTIDTAPPCYRYRYDAFVVGTDGEVDYLKGLEASDNPAKPVIPGGHILLDDYILVKPNVTRILAANIGEEWAPAQIATVEVTWGNWWNGETGQDGDDPPVVKLNWEIFDQYGCRTGAPAGSLSVTISCHSEIGEVSLSSDGPWTASVTTTGRSGTVYQRIATLDPAFYGLFMIYVVVAGGISTAGTGIFREQLQEPD